MPFLPARSGAAYFVGVLSEALRRDWPNRIALCRSGRTGPPQDQVLTSISAEPRLSVNLQGRRGYHLSAGDRLVPFLAEPGDAVFWCPHGWSFIEKREPSLQLGLVFHRTYVRAVAVECRGAGKPTLSHFHHTRNPLIEAGQCLVQALVLQCAHDEADAEATRGILRALLLLVRRHLAEDLATEPMSPRSRRTWQQVLGHLQQHYAEPLSRAGVARALGMHANYLSALCSRYGQRSFHGTLEDLRMAHARHLLRYGDVTVRRVAAMCGYERDGSFIRAFRRRHRQTPERFRQTAAGLAHAGVGG